MFAIKKMLFCVLVVTFESMLCKGAKILLMYPITLNMLVLLAIDEHRTNIFSTHSFFSSIP